MAGGWLQIAALAALYIHQSAAATSLQCHTSYASTPSQHVPTTTVTSTRSASDHEPIYTTTLGTTTVRGDYPSTTTKTVTATFTYSSTEGLQTSYIPTRSGFTPITSAYNYYQAVVGGNKRRAAAATTITSFPAHVTCTSYSTVTRTSYDSTVSTYQHTTTSYTHAGSTKTVTTTSYATTSHRVRVVPTGTFPNECGIDNYVNSFSGSPLDNINEFGRTVFSLPCVPDPGLGTDESCKWTGQAHQSVADCCIAAFMIGAAGFSTDGRPDDGPNGCQVFKLADPNATWYFTADLAAPGPSNFNVGNLANNAVYDGPSD